jgi:hypothetical protein
MAVATCLGASLAACGGSHGANISTPSPAVPTASATPVVRTPLVAVLDHPFGAAPNTLRLLHLDGREVAHVTLDPDAEALTTAGSTVLVAGAGQVRAMSGSGAVTAQVSLPSNATPDLVRGLVGDGSGTRWMWSAVAQSGGIAVTRLYQSGPTGPPTLVMSRQGSGTALQPVAWSSAGPVVAEEPLGIGGYVLFRRTFGAAGLLDVTTQSVRPLADADCAYSDLAADSTVACVLGGREGPTHGSGPVTLRLLRSGGRPPLDVPLPASVAQAGAAFFSPDGTSLSLAMSPALGEGQEQIETDLVDVATGTRHVFGPAGLIPTGWLPDGRLVAVRLPGVAGGDVGTYVVDRDGKATLVCAASTVVGILR